jgi:geranylgeranyl pyrophosphate synthase
MSKKSSERYHLKESYFSYLRETALATNPYVAEFIDNSFQLHPSLREDLSDCYRFDIAQLRPALVRLAYELIGGSNWLEIIPACAALEMRDTAYYRYDRVADLGGDPKLFLLASAYVTLSNQMMAQMENHLALSELFKLDENNISGGFIEMEQLSTEEKYYKKVAAFNFWENAFRIGALLSNQNKEKIKLIGEIGKNIGMAYIIANDTWDFAKDFEDFEAGKYSLPIIQILENPDNMDEQYVIKSLFGKKTNPDQRNRIKYILGRSGYFMYGRMRAQELCIKANELLSVFPESQAKRLIEFSMTMTQTNKYFSQLKCFKM